MEPTEQHYRSLAAKLDALELSDGEEAALGVLLGATGDDEGATGAEVEGYAKRIYVGNLPVRGFNIGMPPSFRARERPAGSGIIPDIDEFIAPD